MLLPTFHHGDYPLARLARAKGSQVISVCLPARNEAATIGAVIRAVPRPLVDEVIVVDDGSVDATAAEARAAGARVVDAAEILPSFGTGPGKGAAMWRAGFVAEGDVVVFCDADVTNFGPHFVTGLLGPLLLDDQASMVKAFYARPLGGRLHEGGRVTELLARPVISTFFPHLAGVIQPLSGECGLRRHALESVEFASGYGVELGLLVDVAAAFGPRALAQVDLGVRVHRNRPLDELAPQAMAILQTALRRAKVDWRPEWSTALVRPGSEPAVVDETFLPPLLEVPTYRRRSA